MEHMIGLTDTAYLGRVGEVELGASALAGVYYLVIYMLGFSFSVWYFHYGDLCLRPLICLRPICSTG